VRGCGTSLAANCVRCCQRGGYCPLCCLLAGRELGSGRRRERAGLVVDPHGGAARRSLHGDFQRVWAVAFSPDGQALATAGESADVQLWDTFTGQLRSSMAAPPATVRSIAFSSDARLLAATVGTGVRVWDVPTRSLRATIYYRHAEALTVAFSPGAALLAVAGASREIGLWDLAGGRWRTKLRAAEGTIQCVAFAPDGQLLAAGANQVAASGHIHLPGSREPSA